MSQQCVYILCFDDTSEEIAKRDFKNNFVWAQPFRIKNNLFMDSSFYASITPKMEKTIRNQPWSWVGTLSYKAGNKISISNFNSKLNDPWFAHHYDVLTFFNPDPLMTYKEQMTAYHTSHFINALETCLREVGENESDIAEIHKSNIICFYSNYWIAKPLLFLQYCNWVKKILLIAATHSNIQKMLWVDSFYKGNADTYNIFGTSFYPLHPFLGERLPCYYFYTRHCRICNPFQLNNT